MRFITLLIMILSASIGTGLAFAQKVEPKEEALLDVIYNHKTVLDTADRAGVFKIDRMTLRIGPTMSAYYSADAFYRDSIRLYNPDLSFELYMAEMKKKQETGADAVIHTTRTIYKNCPEGKVTEFDRYNMDRWKYEETWEKPEWELTDSVRTILGYECQMAVTEYRGRKWHAWFTTDIPLQDGPWKLCNLPGLILSAHDADYDYIIEVVGMNKPAEKTMVGYFDFDKNRITTTRDRHFRDRYRFMNRDNKTVNVMGKTFKVRETPHNYDFEEINYPH